VKSFAEHGAAAAQRSRRRQQLQQTGLAKAAMLTLLKVSRDVRPVPSLFLSGQRPGLPDGLFSNLKYQFG
jgi:hypothetical protein